MTIKLGDLSNNLVPLISQDKDEKLLIDDYFDQPNAFQISEELMTQEFVREHVRCPEKQALLLDLR